MNKKRDYISPQGSYGEPLLGNKQKYYWVMVNQCPNL
jgi:hypothetical protein